MKYIPRRYQIDGRDFLRPRKYAYLGDAPGVGKTGQAIIAREKSWRTLVVTPASVKVQWQKALLDWTDTPSAIIDNSKCRTLSDKPVTIVNYDLMIRKPLLALLKQPIWDLIIFDEAHKLKNMAAQRTKAALSIDGLRPRARRIWFLSGTPVKNRTIDLYPILRSCAPEVMGPYQSYLKFAYRYCGAYQGRFGLDTSGASNTDELCERLKGFMLRREKRDVLTELPPRVVSHIELECTHRVRELIYDEELKTIDKAGDSDPALFKLGEINRIRQVLAKYKVDLCVDYIKDLLEEEDKIVVFYHHKEVLRELQKSFKNIKSVFIDGSVATDKRGETIENFRRCADPCLFFGQMGACGEGIDGLQHVSSTCVFVEPSWSHTDLEQCIGRLERDGQRSDVNVHILTIKDTLEARMMQTVAEKLDVDKALYGQKPTQTKEEKRPMAKTKENAMEELNGALGAAFAVLVKNAVKEALTEVLQKPQPATTAVEAEEVPVKVGKAAPKAEEAQEVEVDEEEDVAESVIRDRAGDVCQADPENGRNEVINIVKKICGGKIADLKTPKQRVAALKALDKAYAEASKKKEDM